MNILSILMQLVQVIVGLPQVIVDLPEMTFQASQVLATTITPETVGLVTAVGIIINAYLTYRLQAKAEESKKATSDAALKTEQVRLELEKNNAAKIISDKAISDANEAAKKAAEIADGKLDKLTGVADETLKTGKETYDASNHNYQAVLKANENMQKDLKASREETATISREFREFIKASKSSVTVDGLPPTKGPELTLAKLDIGLVSKSHEEAVEGDVVLSLSPKPEESKPEEPKSE